MDAQIQIPYGCQDINTDDIDAVVQALRSEWLTTGPAVERFERDLELWTGGTSAVAVSSGTAALHSAYAAAGIGRGDEVITPPITFIATQAAAVHLGAIPVFADVLHETATLDPSAVEAAITSRTVAVVAVDYAGHPAELDELKALTERHGLLLIQDSAHSLGSTYRSQFVGSIADITTFSFFPTKNITTGEGGAICAKDPAILDRARRFSHQGLVRDRSQFTIQDQGDWHQEVPEFGLNYRLPDILAALGSQQLRRLAAFKARRAEIKAFYDRELANLGDLTTPIQRPFVDPVWHLYPIRVPRSERRRVFDELRTMGVGVQVNYLPSYRHPAFTAVLEQIPDCPNAEAFYAEEISLPMFTKITELELERVVAAVRKCLP